MIKKYNIILCILLQVTLLLSSADQRVAPMVNVSKSDSGVSKSACREYNDIWYDQEGKLHSLLPTLHIVRRYHTTHRPLVALPVLPLPRDHVVRAGL